MYYVYVLYSEKDNNFYVGYTKDVKKRLKMHQSGKVKSTRNRRPLNLVYYEASLNQEDALSREKYLKTSYGKRYIKNRLENYLGEKNDGEKN
ncbi:MAG: GIY-YIG nuclease family protein [Candidatus Bipolaricaulota bacterium]